VKYKLVLERTIFSAKVSKHYLEYICSVIFTK